MFPASVPGQQSRLRNPSISTLTAWLQRSIRASFRQAYEEHRPPASNYSLSKFASDQFVFRLHHFNLHIFGHQYNVIYSQRLDLPSVIGKGFGIHDFTGNRIRTPTDSFRCNPMLSRISKKLVSAKSCLQCFDAVGWAAGRASGL